ncbi:MAG: hypothetical protein IJX38_06190 [Clostridia bacterium]|nr:hypothetical protein [Clostridia bacterium]
MDSNNTPVVEEVMQPQTDEVGDSLVTAKEDTAYNKVLKSPFHLIMLICLGLFCVYQAFYSVALLATSVASLFGVELDLGLRVIALGDSWWMRFIYGGINVALLVFLVIAFIGALKLYFGISEHKSILQMNDLAKGSSTMKIFAIFNAIDLVFYGLAALLLSFDLRYSNNYTPDPTLSWSEKLLNLFNFSGYTSIELSADTNMIYDAVAGQSPLEGILTDLAWTMDVFNFKTSALRTLLAIGVFLVFAGVALLLVTSLMKMSKCYENLVTRAGNDLAVMDQKPPVVRLYILAVVQVIMVVIGFMAQLPVAAAMNIVLALYYVSNALYLGNAYKKLSK